MGALILMAQTQGHWLANYRVCHARMLLTLISLLAATQLNRLLGVTGMQVITRVMGVLLCALAVQFVFDGIAESGLLPALEPRAADILRRNYFSDQEPIMSATMHWHKLLSATRFGEGTLDLEGRGTPSIKTTTIIFLRPCRSDHLHPLAETTMCTADPQSGSGPLVGTLGRALRDKLPLGPERQ